MTDNDLIRREDAFEVVKGLRLLEGDIAAKAAVMLLALTADRDAQTKRADDAEADRDARLTQAAAKRLIMNAVPLAAKACRIADEGRDAAIARAEAAEAKVAMLLETWI